MLLSGKTVKQAYQVVSALVLGGGLSLSTGMTVLAASTTLQDKPKLLESPSLLLAQNTSCAATFFGPSGGGGGGESSFTLPNRARIQSIQIRRATLAGGATVVSGIRINYVTNTGVNSSFVAGATTGTANTINFASNETIRSISGRWGQLLDSLTIRTSVRTYGPFGGSGGTGTFSYPVPPLYQFAGFRIRSGNVIDAIGLGIRRTNCNVS